MNYHPRNFRLPILLALFFFLGYGEGAAITLFFFGKTSLAIHFMSGVALLMTVLIATRVLRISDK